MTFTIPCEKFLKSFSYAHVNDAFLVDEGWSIMNSFMELKATPLSKVKALKERGNDLFKQKSFDSAAACYDEACKLLGFSIGAIGDQDTKILSDLAVSLNLNLAACALKLYEHEAAKDLCSLVVSFFPRNVKALFRRALAFMQLKMFVEALSDLEKALLVEPKNKDILRELNVVKNHLIVNSNGKRSSQAVNMNDTIREGKKPILDLESHRENSEGKIGCSFVAGYCSSSSSNSTEGKKISNCGNLIQSSTSQSSTIESNGMGLDTKLETQQVGDVHNFLEFSKKGGGHSHLRITKHTYQKLLEGKEVSFYQNSQMSVMKVRILKPTNPKPKENIHTPSKKKKRRRRLKKGKQMVKDVIDKDMTIPPLEMKEANARECESTSTNPSSLVQDVNHATLSQQASMNLNRDQPFFFSAEQKIRKLFRARRLLALNHDQEEQPQRHIFSTFPGKFPRSCNVNVSRRYFFMANLKKRKKKRKKPSSSMPYSDNPPKKFAVMIHSSPSLLYGCFSNNVLGRNDSKSLTSIM